MRRAGLERGIFEGRRAWLVLGGLAWGLHLLGRAAGREERVVYREELAPGQRLVISRASAPEPRGRRGRR
jgi:hypothetical protein